ncbi:acyltransferase [Streptomyces sp. N35]|uniref:acyltransferase family protein n=1 Tax=Streptomyces sp. N35 TaxID=2795730 RepID=UPI0018F7C9F9|nr:acyltransferase [Streptomyces sp. N35]
MSTHRYDPPGAGHPDERAEWPSYGVPEQRAQEADGRDGWAAQAAQVEGPGQTGPAPKPARDRYLDLLRSLALLRVVAYHVFGWAWLTLVFPSMGVMFALAGSLMARSLKRPAWGVIRGRLRRLLPPVWLFAAVILPLMFWGGWKPARDLGGTWLLNLFMYLVPVGAPPYPGSVGDPTGLFEGSWAEQAVGPLWYIRAYLWFVIASPLLLWAFRRAPWPTLLAPLALTAIVGTGLVTIPGETGLAVTDFAVYGACWILGFAHQDGLLRRVPRHLVVSLAAMVMGFGLWWASGHLGPEGWDLNEIPLAQATWSLGFVVILLVYAPSWRQLPPKLAGYGKLITLSNNRAVTIYLWHNMLIMCAERIVDRAWDIPYVGDHFSERIESTYSLWTFVLVMPLIGLTILAVGWAEDLAAKRRPQLWPNGTGRKTGSHTR